MLHRHWRKLAVLVLLIVAGLVYAASSSVREKTREAWDASLAWAGFGEAAVASGKVFWCPMHPQIESKKENAVCPICNMALVELEGGSVEASKAGTTK